MNIRTCRDCGAQIVFLQDHNDRWVPADADTVDTGDREFDESQGHTRHRCTRSRRAHGRDQGRAIPAPQPRSAPAPVTAAPRPVQVSAEQVAKTHQAKAAIIFWFTEDTIGFESFGATTESMEQARSTAAAIQGQLSRGLIPCP